MTMNESSRSGILVVDKPSGWTSHQVVGRVRRLVGTKKVGHAGTLDPMATGVLVIGVNKATRLLGYLAGHDKDYTATIRLGQETFTDDAEGEVVSETAVAEIDRERLDTEIAELTGDISQVPSTVSAIKVDGQRAYAKARRGESVELAARPVTVSRFTVDDVRTVITPTVPAVDVDVSVTCSAGTYIRSLARDLGRAMGFGGHLTALRRTRVGPFTLTGAVLPRELDEPNGPLPLRSLGDVASDVFDTVALTSDQATHVRYGRSLQIPVRGLTALLYEGDLMGLYQPGVGSEAKPVAVFTS